MNKPESSKKLKIKYQWASFFETKKKKKKRMGGEISRKKKVTIETGGREIIITS